MKFIVVLLLVLSSLQTLFSVRLKKPFKLDNNKKHGYYWQVLTHSSPKMKENQSSTCKEIISALLTHHVKIKCIYWNIILKKKKSED